MSSSSIRDLFKGQKYDVILLAFGVILMMLRSMRILYVRPFPEIFTHSIGICCVTVYIITNYRKLEKFTLFSLTVTFLLIVIYIYDILRVNAFNIKSVIGLAGVLMGAIVIVQAPLEDKRFIYRTYNLLIQLLVGIGVIWWILYLCNFPLTYIVDNSDNFYQYHVYTFFNIVINPNSIEILPRFAGPFLEPGHLGTMCIYLLYINSFNLKNIGNIALLLGIIFSLSLAAYGLLIGAVLIYLFNRRKYFSIGIMAAIFVIIGIGSQYFNNGDNPLYQIVFSRLELTENGDDIVGNNRTSVFFDLAYAKYLNSDKTMFGVGTKAFGKQSDGSDNVTMGTAGYKRYFYLRGYFGMIIICAFLLIYTLRYKSRMSIGYLIIYIIANIIRDYPTKEIWMYLFLLCIPLLYYYGTRINYPDEEDDMDGDRSLDYNQGNVTEQ
ncbi:MAG: hypothetical protein K2H86_05625 [Muribaculaceae bacterium]|nr:hypothetical protein [Muribaculaceae bacterium]